MQRGFYLREINTHKPSKNSLPAGITNSPSLTVFRNRLKTFLFHHTFSGCLAD